MPGFQNQLPTVQRYLPKLWRTEKDSNLRDCDICRFSKPVVSTAHPSIRFPLYPSRRITQLKTGEGNCLRSKTLMRRRRSRTFPRLSGTNRIEKLGNAFPYWYQLLG